MKSLNNEINDVLAHHALNVHEIPLESYISDSPILCEIQMDGLVKNDDFLTRPKMFYEVTKT